MECEADENTNGAFIAFAYLRANLSISSISSGGSVVNRSNFVPTRKACAVYNKSIAIKDSLQRTAL
jgi:hypothetical protein